MNTEASPAEIAAATDTSTDLVHKVFQRYGIESKSLESFKKHKADIYAGIQEKISAKLSAAIPNIALMNARDVKDATTALGIVHDKEQLERGKPTGIIDIRALVAVVEAEERAILAELKPAITREILVPTAQKPGKISDDNG